MAEGGNGSVYSAAQVLDLLEEKDFEDMEMDESDDLHVHVHTYNAHAHANVYA